MTRQAPFAGRSRKTQFERIRARLSWVAPYEINDRAVVACEVNTCFCALLGEHSSDRTSISGLVRLCLAFGALRALEHILTALSRPLQTCPSLPTEQRPR